METKLCPGCHTDKAIEEFNYKDKVKGTRQTRCRECTRLQVKRHYVVNQPYYVAKARKRNIEQKRLQRELLKQYLSSHPCVDCGETDIVCLEFDHVNGHKKRNVAELVGECKWAVIEAEIAKCEVRCANCHRRKTAKQFGWYLTTNDVRP